MAFSLLHELTVFSLFPIIIGDILQRTAAATIDQQVTDGGQFLERIVHGEKISQNPGYLLFTAPYKLCEGGCEENDEENFAMVFPLYIGKQGLEKYHEIYARDHKNIHSEKPNAPFKKRPTKKLFTLCPSEVTTEKRTEITTETETSAPETLLTTTKIETTTNKITTESAYSTAETNSESNTSEITTETETSPETLLTTKIETTTNEITTESEYSTAETNSESNTSANKHTINTELETTSTKTAATTWTLSNKESTTSSSELLTIQETATHSYENLTPKNTNTELTITESPISTNTETPPTANPDTPTTKTRTTIRSTILSTNKSSFKTFYDGGLLGSLKTPTPELTTSSYKLTFSTNIHTTFTAVLTTPTPEIITNKHQTFETKDTKKAETLPMESEEISTTETAQFHTDITETEDITFESYTDGDYTDTTIVTNANGVRCPPRQCKNKVTPAIINLLVRNRPKTMFNDTRNADWNSDYSDLQDSLDFY